MYRPNVFYVHCAGYASLTTTMKLERSAGLPCLPKRRSDVVGLLRGQWAETSDGQSFLLSTENDMVVFATRSNLKHLANCKTIYVDGTFKTCPKLFSQLLTVHGLFGDSVVPDRFCLLQHPVQLLHRGRAGPAVCSRVVSTPSSRPSIRSVSSSVAGIVAVVLARSFARASSTRDIVSRSSSSGPRTCRAGGGGGSQRPSSKKILLANLSSGGGVRSTPDPTKKNTIFWGGGGKCPLCPP